MRHARSAYFLASLAALLCLLNPALAKADGALGALDWFFQVLLAQTLATVVGFAALIAALVSRSRAVWLFALVATAANGLMGIAILLDTAAQPSLFMSSAALQIVLGLVGCPSLVAWRRSPRSAAEPGLSSLLVSRWLLLWILGHVAAVSVVSLLAQPLANALLVNESGLRAGFLSLLAVVDGVVLGALAGAVQWLLLRRALAMSPLWVAFTILGFVAASVATTPFGSYFSSAASIGGALIGAMQWPLLRDRLRKAWLWIVVSALVGLAHWPLLRLHSEFPGARPSLVLALTALKALLTGLTLQYLARLSASTPPAANEH